MPTGDQDYRLYSTSVPNYYGYSTAAVPPTMQPIYLDAWLHTPQPQRVQCEYCRTMQPATHPTCSQCGAALPPH